MSKFLSNLKENIVYIKENYPDHIDEYREGIRNISIDVVNNSNDRNIPIPRFQQEYKTGVNK